VSPLRSNLVVPDSPAVTRRPTRTHPATIAYIERRLQEDTTQREGNRRLKSYLARSLPGYSNTDRHQRRERSIAYWQPAGCSRSRTSCRRRSLPRPSFDEEPERRHGRRRGSRTPPCVRHRARQRGRRRAGPLKLSALTVDATVRGGPPWRRRSCRARKERLRQPARPHVRPADAQTESNRPRCRRRYAGTSSRTGLSAGPCSKPITKRMSSAAARRCRVCTDVLCWPLSIREIAE
jgi:hypothetical protein